MNLNQVLTRASANVQRLPTEVQHNVEAFVQAASLQLQTLHNFRCMQAEQSFNTTEASHILGQTPSDWKEQRENPYYLLQIGTTAEILWVPSRTMLYRGVSATDPNQTGAPINLLLGEVKNDTVPDPANPDWSMTSRNIEVYPYPDGLSDWTTAPAGEYRVHIPYWAYVPLPVAYSDTNWLLANAAEFLIAAATAACYEQAENVNMARYWLSRAYGPKWDGATSELLGGWARTAINLDRGMGVAPVKTLVPRRDVFAPRDQWRS